jgi:predicted membrane-bound mannosyltransferase
MSSLDDEKLASFLRKNAPDVPAAHHHLEENILDATVRSSFSAKLRSFIMSKKQKTLWGMTLTAAAVVVALFLQQPQTHELEKQMTQAPSVVTTVNAATLDNELNSFLFETMNGIETKQTLALNSDSDVF